MEIWGWSQSFCPFLQKNMVQQFSSTTAATSLLYLITNGEVECCSACEESCGKTPAVQYLSHRLYPAQCVQLMMNGWVVLKTLPHLPRSS